MAGRLDALGLVAVPIRNAEMRARVVQVQVMKGRHLPDLMNEFIDLLIGRLQSISN
ncbi:hypothetical protein [Oligella sp. MSHR50489EDL]|uniref:hypothetical protein n=1 Tax=Oligella sp. MSHR50489EDL TaxID=3139409 RepID=UPI003D81C2CA